MTKKISSIIFYELSRCGTNEWPDLTHPNLPLIDSLTLAEPSWATKGIRITCWQLASPSFWSTFVMVLE
jgi:hypothetical protein